MYNILPTIRENLPSRPSRQSAEQGFTLIELMINIVILFIAGSIVLIGIFAFISFGNDYDAEAFSMVEEQKVYHTVRLPDDGKLGGVCAGLGYRWGIDPWIPRGAFIVATFVGAHLPRILVFYGFCSNTR